MVDGENPYGEWMKAGYKSSQGNMRRRPQDVPQLHERTDRSDREEGLPPAAAEPNSNSGALIIYEAAKKSGIHDEGNKIPPVTKENQTKTDSHLMLVDSTSKETYMNGVNAESLKTKFKVMTFKLSLSNTTLPLLPF